MDIKSLVSNVIAICILILLFLLAFTWIFFDFYKTSSSLKDSLSIVGSLFGGIATLAAAYIASKLFNDWKEQHNKNIEAQLCMKAFDYIQGFEFELIDIERFTINYLISSDKRKLMKKFDENLERLNVIADKSSIVLSDLGFFIPTKEYDKKFKPQFDIIIDQLQQYISTYDSAFRAFDHNQNHEKYIQTYRQLTASLRERYRATFVELNQYYKAL